MHRGDWRAEVKRENTFFNGCICLLAAGMVACLLAAISQILLDYGYGAFPIAAAVVVVAFAGFGIALIVKSMNRPDPSKCPICGYDLRGNRANGCPECGWKRNPHSRE